MYTMLVCHRLLIQYTLQCIKAGNIHYFNVLFVGCGDERDGIQGLCRLLKHSTTESNLKPLMNTAFTNGQLANMQ